MAFYNGKIGVQGGSQMMWNSVYMNLCPKSFPFIVSETLDACAYSRYAWTYLKCNTPTQLYN